MMSNLLDNLGDEDKRKLKKVSPCFQKPMLAILTRDPFSSEEWIYEEKYDGERCMAVGEKGRVTLYSRTEKKLNRLYPELVEALERQELESFVADGEIVAYDADVTSLKRLQSRTQNTSPKGAPPSQIDIYYCLFDLLLVDGYEITKLPLVARKRILRQAFDFKDPIRFTEYRETDGLAYLQDACDRGWEGVIAKQKDAPYVHSRSKKWVKFKCVNRQEFIICGFTEPQGNRIGFGALLIGYFKGGKLHYAGKVGTGFDHKTLKRLYERLVPIEQKEPVFIDDEDFQEKNVHWVVPKLVCEVGFTEWTRDGKLRHPRYFGIREDKEPEEVVREKGEEIADESTQEREQTEKHEEVYD